MVQLIRKCRNAIGRAHDNSQDRVNQDQGRPVTQRSYRQVQQTEFYARDEDIFRETTRKEDESDSCGVRAFCAIADLRSMDFPSAFRLIDCRACHWNVLKAKHR